MYSKAAPQLVLSLNEQKLSARLSHPVYGGSETQVTGLVVGVQKKSAGLSSQMWTFTADGNICPQVCKGVVTLLQHLPMFKGHSAPPHNCKCKVHKMLFSPLLTTRTLIIIIIIIITRQLANSLPLWVERSPQCQAMTGREPSCSQEIWC